MLEEDRGEGDVGHARGESITAPAASGDGRIAPPMITARESDIWAWALMVVQMFSDEAWPPGKGQVRFLSCATTESVRRRFVPAASKPNHSRFRVVVKMLSFTVMVKVTLRMAWLSASSASLDHSRIEGFHRVQSVTCEHLVEQ